VSKPSIYEDATRLAPPPPVCLTPSGVVVGRGRLALSVEELSRIAPFHIDGFAGGGGASEGYYLATGRHADMAWNHDEEALAMHRANHPFTKHFKEDIRRVKWRLMIRQVVTSAHFSPDCKDFSKAKGGKPKSKRIRGLAWTIIHMINELGPFAPLVLTMENVEEFADWCPLLPDGTRNKALLGWFFKCFIGALERRGYHVEWRELRACDHSRAPTIRKRLYLIARRDGQPIVWTEHSYGEGKPNRQGIAADILDFRLPCPSIFMTRKQARAYTRKTGIKIQRPLARASHKRFADGVERYVMKEKNPFLVCLTHEGNDGVDGIGEPVKTVTGANRGEFSVVAPVLARQQHGGGCSSAAGPVHTIAASAKDQNQVLAVHIAKITSGGVGSAATEAFPTVTANSFKKRPGGNPPLGVVSTFLARPAHGERDRNGRKRGKGSHPVTDALGSVTGSNDLAVGSVFLAQNNGGMIGHGAGEPVSTINAKGANQSLVVVGYAKYYGNESEGKTINGAIGTVTTKERFGLFEAQLEIPVLTPELANKARRVARWLRSHGMKVEGEFAMCGEYVIVDVGMRMLTARELYRAQGFGEDYIIDFGFLEDGTRINLTKTAQVKMCGNSVCPPMAEALFRLNLLPCHVMKEAA
jgi:DNA (cytosine-5)-methyltransferase 1